MILSWREYYFHDNWNLVQFDKDQHYISNKYIEYIDGVGPDHVLQIIINGASANKKVRQDIL